ncbi:MAG: LysM peptidoglycan-binding domain-containing protein [Acidimicrobiales bacterium]
MAAILTVSSHPTPPPARVVPPEVYRRRRLVALAVALGLMSGLASLGSRAHATRPTDVVPPEVVVHVVEPGDTLWHIARSLAPGDDPRPIVAELDRISGGPLLVPGQRLVIPAHLLGR